LCNDKATTINFRYISLIYATVRPRFQALSACSLEYFFFFLVGALERNAGFASSATEPSNAVRKGTSRRSYPV
jgi:hypothetical protein